MLRIMLRLSASLVLLIIPGGCADLPTDPGRPPHAAAGAPLADAATSSCCVLDPVIVVVPGPGEEQCDPYQSLDWCQGDGGQCITSQPDGPEPEYHSISGCNETGGGGPGDGSTGPSPGGGSPTTGPPSPEQPDTCATGDPVVDDPAVQEAFTHLWSNSNYGPGVPMDERIEDGGWIIRNMDGSLRFMSFPVSYPRGPCSIDIPRGVTPPAATVAWVHTHPFAAGEKLTECEWQQIPGVGSLPLTYRNESSTSDDALQARWRAEGYAIAAYVIDANGIVRFDGSGTVQGETRYSRCGY